MGFFNTVINGYKMMYHDFRDKHMNVLPKVFSGTGTGLMMIGSALIARDSAKEDVQQVIAEANQALAEVQKPIEGEKKSARMKRVFKARCTRGWKLVKVYKRGIICDAIGAGLVGVGMGISENGRNRALAATAAIGAEFAGYRAAVRADLGEEADIKYMNGKKPTPKVRKLDKANSVEEPDDGILIKKDPSAFRFWFSRETCPSIWCDNYDLRKHKLEHIEDGLNLRLRAAGHITLNDMRREFGGLEPAKMDVDIGGIFGRIYDPSKPQKQISLHFEDDEDFMEGRTDSCMIIFDCDPEPLIGRIKKKFD